MARKPMVTRTIVSTKATVLACNTADGDELQNVTFIMPRTYNDDEELLKAIKKQHEKDGLVIIKVVDKVKEESLYGMDETDFIAHAQRLDPETRKALEAGAKAEA